MSTHHVLVLGGHGKVSQYLTTFLLQRSWTVTSIIRNPDQVAAVQKLGDNQSGKLNVLVHSLEDVKSDAQARSILDDVRPEYVVWSAGAGGKGGPERTFAIDRDSAVHFINAAAATPSITKFLLVSYIASRRARPDWWDDAAWDSALDVNNNVLSTYYQAKIVADEALYEASKKRPSFVGIDLRPGTLTADPAGNVELGRTRDSRGKVSRESVANVAALLLESGGVKNTWLDLLDGNEDPGVAVARVVREGINTAEGEPVF